MRLRHLLLAAALVTACLPASADIIIVQHVLPGTPAEAAMVAGNHGSFVEGDARRTDLGGYWSYRVIVTPGARLSLTFTTEGEPSIAVYGADAKPLPWALAKAGMDRTVVATAPAKHPLGAALRVQLGAKTGPIAVRDVRVQINQPDRNGNGVADAVEQMMGVPAGQRAVVAPRPDKPHSSFQTGSPYSSAIGIPTDAVLNYTDQADRIQSWLDHGYTVQTMGGFRDGEAFAKQHMDAVQTDRNGKPITIGGNSYYLVPTDARLDIAKHYYEAALAAGSLGVCPEEPEFWTAAGYSPASRQEWLARYGTPWEAPDSSVDARYRSEQLKGFLETRQIAAILDDAQRVKPQATRMVAVHSPVTYYQWGIPVPHFAMLSIPSLQEVIGQVWTGTARTADRSAGVRMERTFETGYLEYSSLYNLARGSGKRMWFLMDPVEDNPGLPMEDYHRNYEQTLAAALMFPQVDSYEVMPWPDRVYGRVPAGYATEINTVVGALCDLWRYPSGTVEAGSEGIGTFVSDSMGWQRGDPSASDYDGFYGLCLPLVMHGVPVQVLSLDRAAVDAGYLSRMKTLLVSYDFLKPADAAANRALAAWTRAGGSLVIFGGTDAYNAVKDSWWRRAGLASPLDDLFTQLGLSAAPPAPNNGGASAEAGTSTLHPQPSTLNTVLQAQGSPHDMSNRRRYTIDLTPDARESGGAVVRFEDNTPQDGWGPQVLEAELRIGGKLAAAFRAGSELETRFLAEEHGTKFNGTARFADGDAWWVYRFDNLPKDQPVTLTVDMGNGFLVKAGPAPDRAPLIETSDKTMDRTVQKLRVPPQYPMTFYAPPAGATPLYTQAGANAPVAWEAKVGSGSVTYVGVPPAFLTATAQTSRWMRELTKRALTRAGGKYEEQERFIARRGPYTVVRTLGDTYTAEGRWVNLLSPTLAVEEDPDVPAHGVALLTEIGRRTGAPQVLAVSGRLRAQSERTDATGFLVQAPAKTDGAARLWRGRRGVAGVRAWDLLGQPVPVTYTVDGDTVLLRYPNDPDGVVVRVGWQP